MKRLIVLSAMLLLAFCAFGQETETSEHLDARDAGIMMIDMTHNELIDFMRNEKCLYMDSSYAIYSVYSKREGKNIKLKAKFDTFKSDVPKVWTVEFIYDTKNTYGTNDLQEAFWLEYIKNPR